MDREQPNVMDIDEDDEVFTPLATGKFADLLETVTAIPVVKKEHIVDIREQSGDTLWFKMHTFTKLRKAMVIYCDGRGYEASELRFTFKGEEVHPRVTPGLLGMGDEECIDVRRR